MNTRALLAAACALVVGASIYLAGEWSRRTLAPGTRTMGAMTTEEALSRSAALCDRVVPGAGRRQMVAARTTKGNGNQYYVVTIQDGDGAEVLNTTWDADSGELLVVCRVFRWNEGAASPLISRETATLAASHWISTLGLAGREEWCIDSVSRRPRGHWLATWHTARRRGSLTVHRATGNLVIAVATPSRDDGQLAAAGRPAQRAPG